MVHELHKRGYQRLRIVPGMSPSGMYWRVAIESVGKILRTDGAMAVDLACPTACYTTGAENYYFEWTDARQDSARVLADKFTRRFADLAREGEGRDWVYAGWYTEMLGVAERGAFPLNYSDYWTDPPRGLMRTTNGQVFLPAPPPGEAEGRD